MLKFLKQLFCGREIPRAGRKYIRKSNPEDYYITEDYLEKIENGRCYMLLDRSFSNYDKHLKSYSIKEFWDYFYPYEDFYKFEELRDDK